MRQWRYERQIACLPYQMYRLSRKVMLLASKPSEKQTKPQKSELRQRNRASLPFAND
jgi:hypothetical protein